MDSREGFWRKPANTVLFVISVLALGISLAALFRSDPVSMVSAQQSALTPNQKQALISMQDGFAAIAEAVEPSVVRIEAITRATESTAKADRGESSPEGTLVIPNPFDLFRQNPTIPQIPTPQGASTGSGLLVKVDGKTTYILTNNHVVDNANVIRVYLAGQDRNSVVGKLVGRDDKSDLAVISIRTPAGVTASTLPKLGDSSKIRVGQWAIAIGNPLGVGETLTVGVISATRRELNRVEGIRDYRDMIQTDASINPGNSGGPLVNIHGEVIGINTAIASSTRGSIGLGFAIPINAARAIMNEIIEHGAVVRGYLGVQTSNQNRVLDEDLKKFYGVQHGALVEMVNPDTPAAKAGIRPEDVIMFWNNQKIEDFDGLEAAVTGTPPGRQIPVKLMRNGKQVTVTVTTAKRPSESDLLASGGSGAVEPEEDNKESVLGGMGMTVSPLRPADAKALNIDENMKGVLVTKVDFGGPADMAGLTRGTLILRVGRTETPTVKEFREATKDLKPGDSVILQINRPVSANQRSNAITKLTLE